MPEQKCMVKSKAIKKKKKTVFPVALKTAGYFRSFLCGVLSYYSWQPPSLHMCLFFIPPLAPCPSHLLISPFSSPPIALSPLFASFSPSSPASHHSFGSSRASVFQCYCALIKKDTKDSLTHKLQAASWWDTSPSSPTGRVDFSATVNFWQNTLVMWEDIL